MAAPTLTNTALLLPPDLLPQNPLLPNPAPLNRRRWWSKPRSWLTSRRRLIAALRDTQARNGVLVDDHVRYQELLQEMQHDLARALSGGPPATQPATPPTTQPDAISSVATISPIPADLPASVL